MNFKYYDILSFLITGALTLVLLHYFGFISTDWTSGSVSQPMLLILSYAAGSLVNAAGALMEKRLNKVLHWPSELILDERAKGFWGYVCNIGRKELSQRETVKRCLRNDLNQFKGDGSGNSASNQELFWQAKLKAEDKQPGRVDDFNAQYAYFRTLLALAVLSLPLMFLAGPVLKLCCVPYWEYLLDLLAIAFLFWRMRMRGFYYARVVLDIYRHSTSEK